MLGILLQVEQTAVRHIEQLRTWLIQCKSNTVICSKYLAEEHSARHCVGISDKTVFAAFLEVTEGYILSVERKRRRR